MTTHNGKRITQRGGADAGRGDNAHMKAREESLGEAGEYEAEAAYADSSRDSDPANEPADDFVDNDKSWLRSQFNDNYRRGY